MTKISKNYFLIEKNLIVLMFILAMSFNIPATFANIDTKPNETGPWRGMYVNTYTGNFFYQRNDLFIPGVGVSIDMNFNYNSGKSQLDIGYGFGWSTSFSMYYTMLNDTLLIDCADGHQEFYIWNGASYDSPVGIYNVLTEYQTDKYLLTTKYGKKYYFDDLSHKKITSIEDRNGNALTFSYSGNLLTQITDVSGRQINLSWSDGHLDEISDPNTSPNRSYDYQYDAEWNLIVVTNPLGFNTQYEYGSSSELTRITDALSQQVDISYNVNTAVSGMFCTEEDYDKEFVYDTLVGITTVNQNVGSTNRETNYTFDENGRVISIERSDAGNELFAWDNMNNISDFTDGNNNLTQYIYDDHGNLLTITDPLGNSDTYIYETVFNQMTSETDKNGNSTSYNYDGYGNLSSITDPLGNIEAFTYNANGNRLSETDKNGNTTLYAYNNNGYVTSVTDPDNQQEFNTYDAVGNLLSFTDKNGNITTYTYNLLNNRLSTENAQGNITEFTYDVNCNIIDESDENGNTYSYEFDALRNMVEYNDPDGNIVYFTYDEVNNKTSVTDKNGNTTSFAYDSDDNLISVTDPLGNVQTYTYDLNGNMISVTDGNNMTTDFTYDALNRELSNTDANGNTESYNYDPASNIIGHTDRKGKTSSFTYDENNRLLSSTDPLSNTESLSYDANGNIISITDANGNITEFTYDELNNLLSIETQMGKTCQYAYDPCGNTISKTDGNGNLTTYAYNELNILSDISYADGSVVNMLLDPAGYISQINNTGGIAETTSFEYDNLQRLTSKEVEYGPFSRIVNYSYDPDGNLLTLNSPNNNIVWDYDQANQIINIIDHQGGQTHFNYDDAGNIISIDYPNNVSSSIVHDNLNRIESISINNNSKTILQSYDYEYDVCGNKIKESRADGTVVDYIYDDNGRLLSETNSSTSNIITYTYDAAGNRLTKNTNGEIDNYLYDADNLLLSEGFNSYLYDDNGNRIVMLDESTDDITNYAWDMENRLSHLVLPGSEIVSYYYSPFGNTLATDNNGYMTYNLFNNSSSIEQISVDGFPITLYNPNISIQHENIMGYYQNDGFGSATILTNDQSDVVAKSSFDEFGNLTDSFGWWMNDEMWFRGLNLDTITCSLEGMFGSTQVNYDPKRAVMLAKLDKMFADFKADMKKITRKYRVSEIQAKKYHKKSNSVSGMLSFSPFSTKSSNNSNNNFKEILFSNKTSKLPPISPGSSRPGKIPPKKITPVPPKVFHPMPKVWIPGQTCSVSIKLINGFVKKGKFYKWGLKGQEAVLMKTNQILQMEAVGAPPGGKYTWSRTPTRKNGLANYFGKRENGGRASFESDVDGLITITVDYETKHCLCSETIYVIVNDDFSKFYE